jgi:hypothetical protein
MADAPFVALVMPTDGDVKVYVKGIEPEQMLRIQHAIERILATPKDANPDDPDVVSSRVPRCNFDGHMPTLDGCECGDVQKNGGWGSVSAPYTVDEATGRLVPRT